MDGCKEKLRQLNDQCAFPCRETQKCKICCQLENICSKIYTVAPPPPIFMCLHLSEESNVITFRKHVIQCADIMLLFIERTFFPYGIPVVNQHRDWLFSLQRNSPTMPCKSSPPCYCNFDSTKDNK